ncbi:MAG: protein-methionine-sulfoxide reductase catalytic subunit MsrP, partial [Kiloniellales bacterium]
MLVKIKRGWELAESSATPESVYLSRRDIAKALAAGPLLLAGAALIPGTARAAKDPWAGLIPAMRNLRYRLKRDITPEEVVTTYNNFYEFGSHKKIYRAAQALKVRPWTVRIDGMVETEIEIDIDDLVRRLPMEDRLYRHRCVEAWSMRVPYTGFPLKALVDMARPKAGARYLEMETVADKAAMPGLKQFWYPWPYIEGLTLAEAINELAFVAIGLYGKRLPKQNGAPLRLAVPWKYGFKHIKSIVRFTFTDKRPISFWEEVQGREYGFWANVNPEVSHPRWSQATERDIGTGERIP